MKTRKKGLKFGYECSEVKNNGDLDSEMPLEFLLLFKSHKRVANFIMYGSTEGIRMDGQQ